MDLRTVGAAVTPTPGRKNANIRLHCVFGRVVYLLDLQNRRGGSPVTLRASQALSKVENWHRELSQMALKSLSRLHMAPGA